jgi:hypothetical protein
MIMVRQKIRHAEKLATLQDSRKFTLVKNKTRFLRVIGQAYIGSPRNSDLNLFTTKKRKKRNSDLNLVK